MVIQLIQWFDIYYLTYYHSYIYILVYTLNFQSVHDNNIVNGTHKSLCKYCDVDGLSLKSVSSVHEFLQNWKTANQKNNYELYYKLLRSIKPKDLPKGKWSKIIWNFLDDTITFIYYILSRHLLWLLYCYQYD